MSPRTASFTTRRRLLAALGAGALLSACSSTDLGPPRAEAAGGPDTETVTGTARIEGSVSLPPGAVLLVSVVDVSRADARSTTLAQVRLPLTGPAPWSFSLPVQRRLLQERGSYSVRAEIDLDGQAAFVTDRAYGVLGHSDRRHAELLLRPVDQRTQAAAARIVGRRWVLVSLDGQALGPQDPATAPHFTLHPDGQRVSGSGGCNPLVGTYRLNGAALQLLRGAPTEPRPCEANIERERALRFALATTEQWSLEGRRLRLFDRLGAQVAVFEAVPAL